MKVGIVTIPIYVLAFALFLFGYLQLETVKFMHPAAFSAFFVGMVFWLVSFLRTPLRVELALASLALTGASTGLACADGACETAMTLFPAFTVLCGIWTTNAICWRHNSGACPRSVALLWRYGLPIVLIVVGIGMYFQFFPVVR